MLTRRTLLATGLGTGLGLGAGLAGCVPVAQASGPTPTAGGATSSAASQPLGLISLTAAAAGKFRRVRVANDHTRLKLSYPNGAGKVTGQKLIAPSHYGLDFTAFPAGSHGEQYLQDLFDNTPFEYLAFYFATTGHPSTSWSGTAPRLFAQGWNLVPVYVGRQQYWPHTTDNQISSSTATATNQGKVDGKKAVSLATAEKFPHGSRLYLDIEGTQNPSGPHKGADGPPTAQTIAYIKAWLAAVNGSGKYKGALYDANAKWKVGTTTHYDSNEINAKLGAAAPTTWVLWDPGQPPVGVSVGVWPLDPNGDVAAVAVKAYSTNPQWGFTAFAGSWQFKLDWKPTGVKFLADTGLARNLTSIAAKVDLDASKTYDPGNTAPGRPKSVRRTATTSVTVDKQTVRPGESLKITVKVNQPAAAPNGALVLLRSTSPYLLLPSSARVAAKASSVVVTAMTALGAPAAAITVRARVLNQLTDSPPEATIQVSR